MLLNFYYLFKLSYLAVSARYCLGHFKRAVSHLNRIAHTIPCATFQKERKYEKYPYRFLPFLDKSHILVLRVGNSITNWNQILRQLSLYVTGLNNLKFLTVKPPKMQVVGYLS